MTIGIIGPLAVALVLLWICLPAIAQLWANKE